MKRILITGANSYIGTNVEAWLNQWPEEYEIETVDMKDDTWREKGFLGFDVVFHVAGIVHKKEKKENEQLYFKINKELPIEVAKKALDSGVKQFIFMSTMAIYGEEGRIGEDVVITKETCINPKTYYGKSKAEAEYELNKLRTKYFKIAFLRPPMVYGEKSLGNYAKLEKFALITPVFPLIENKRSMVSINRLCQYVKKCIDTSSEEIIFPQNREYVNTSLLVKKIAEDKGKKIYMSKALGTIFRIIGKRTSFGNKIFGNLVYDNSEIDRM